MIIIAGNLDKINALQKQLHVRPSPSPKSHGTEIVLINPEASVQAYFYYPISSKDLEENLNRIM